MVVYRARDFLLGITVESTDLVPNNSNNKDDLSPSSPLRQGFTEAVRLQLIYDILTSSEKAGGADISPHVDPFVDSIMPLHNDNFNKVKRVLRCCSTSSYMFAMVD